MVGRGDAVAAGRAVVTPGRARTAIAVLSEVAVVPRTLFVVMGGSRQRNLGGGFALGSRPTQQ
jgi:hypothetical protein